MVEMSAFERSAILVGAQVNEVFGGVWLSISIELEDEITNMLASLADSQEDMRVGMYCSK